jgi:hypothetical protein
MPCPAFPRLTCPARSSGGMAHAALIAEYLFASRGDMPHASA